jgi:succinate-semialdehyde dehydrogenase/glutarate-semialdehyde dehydrogenase
VTYNPLGTVLIIMPWNFPFWQVFRQASTALAAGNTMLLKHAPNVFGCAEAIERIFQEASCPDGVFQNVPVDGPAASRLIAHHDIKAVAVTGSSPVGAIVGAAAGGLIKPHVLELGGSDPYLILEDADLDLAVAACTAGRLLNCGQSCIGAKRFVVHERVHDEFVEKVHAALTKCAVCTYRRAD